MSQAVSFEVRAAWNANKKQGKYMTNNGLSCFSPVINIMRHPLWGRNQVNKIYVHILNVILKRSCSGKT